MPSYKSTIKNLISIELDILKNSRDSAWFRHINKDAVERFYNLNKMPLSYFKQTVNAINASFLAKDDDGEILFEKDEVTGKESYVFLNDEAAIAYKSAMKEFGEKEVFIFY